jgi:chromosome segregation ATPase
MANPRGLGLAVCLLSSLRQIGVSVPRSRDEIQADLDRLQSELAEADETVSEVLEEESEIIEEAIEAHDEAVEEAAEDAAEAIAEAVEDAADDAAEDSPLTDEPEAVEDEVAARVIEILAEKYNLHPVVTTEVAVDDSPVIAPVGEHFKYRKIF